MAEASCRRGRGFRPYLPQDGDDTSNTATCNVVTCLVPARSCAAVLAKLNGILPLTRYNLHHLKRSRTAAGNSAEKEVIVVPERVWRDQVSAVTVARQALATGLECDCQVFCEPLAPCGSGESHLPEREQASLRIVAVPQVQASDFDAHARSTKLWPMRLLRSKIEAKHTACDVGPVPPPLPGGACSATGCPADGPDDKAEVAEAVPHHDGTVNSGLELVLLFYKYAALLPDEAQKLRAWHESACTKLGLSGRVLVATEGINGTVAGTPSAVRRYMAAVKTISDPRCEGFDAAFSTSDIDSSIAHGEGEGVGEGGCEGEDEDEHRDSCLAISHERRCRFADVDFKMSSHNVGAAVGALQNEPLFEPRCPKDSSTYMQEASPGQKRAFSGLSVRLVPELISTKWQWAPSTAQGLGRTREEDERRCGLAQGQQHVTGREQEPEQSEAQYPDDGLAGRHLPPAEFHAMLAETVGDACKGAESDTKNGGSSVDGRGKETVVLDVRNSKEFSIGHFEGATDIGMRSFCEFDSICRDNLEALRGKRVMMYCTGGIRCEKASAWLRNQGPEFQDVYQLRGGIHRYLEWAVAQSKAGTAPGAGIDAAAPGGLFRGKNFVFDGRVAMSAEEHDGGAPSAPCQRAETGEVVGRCAYCDAPWASLEGGVTCAVCRDPVLACDACRRALPVRDEYHCPSHFELRHCYFRSLDKWAAGSGESDISNVQALRLQAAELDRFEQALRGDKLQRNRRRTLRRQRARVLERLASFSENT